MVTWFLEHIPATNTAVKMPPPDADLHPEATGLAKELVHKHSAPQPLKLYAGWFCPFGMTLGRGIFTRISY